jgi:hypothetical protein
MARAGEKQGFGMAIGLAIGKPGKTRNAQVLLRCPIQDNTQVSSSLLGAAHGALCNLENGV